MVYHMISIGEEAGTTEEMLEKLADYYDEEVEMATQSHGADGTYDYYHYGWYCRHLMVPVMAPMMEMYTRT